MHTDTSQKMHFDDFINLSIVVCSNAINDIKKKWITIDFNELWGEIVIEKKSILGRARHDGKW